MRRYGFEGELLLLRVGFMALVVGGIALIAMCTNGS